ncbi:hypothetical protein KIN20_034448 [Parelaphostrongylus tenuis]|uniref:Uncharacterized protein n=1 Tax=Parelaphostrongylus tenuis TaxID=148309 RepID=A0AAD5R9N9_PARTN|nr:hypothetical protein KIN20_034448 [Parelaphostrongylus tenuis]
MSEPDSRLPTTAGRIPSGTTSVGALPPLTLPPPRVDPLAGITSVHHTYASSLSNQSTHEGQGSCPYTEVSYTSTG